MPPYQFKHTKDDALTGWSPVGIAADITNRPKDPPEKLHDPTTQTEPSRCGSRTRAEPSRAPAAARRRPAAARLKKRLY